MTAAFGYLSSMTDHTHLAPESQNEAQNETQDEATIRRGSPVQAAATLVGVTFVLVGVLGFIPGVTTGGLHAAGHESHAELLGLFQVSVLHNVLHLVLGAAGIFLARTASSARSFLVGGGALYLVLWLYGLLVDQASQANVVPLNAADDWLHLVLGVVMVALGVVLGRRPAARR